MNSATLVQVWLWELNEQLITFIAMARKRSNYSEITAALSQSQVSRCLCHPVHIHCSIYTSESETIVASPQSRLWHQHHTTAKGSARAAKIAHTILTPAHVCTYFYFFHPPKVRQSVSQWSNAKYIKRQYTEANAASDAFRPFAFAGIP